MKLLSCSWVRGCYEILPTHNYGMFHCLSGSKSLVAKEELDWATSHGHDSSGPEAVEDVTGDGSPHQTEAKTNDRKQKKRRKQEKVHVIIWHLVTGCKSVGVHRCLFVTFVLEYVICVMVVATNLFGTISTIGMCDSLTTQ